MKNRNLSDGAGVSASSGVGIISVVNIVFAILINFSNAEKIQQLFCDNSLGRWYYRCLEGWSCIPFIILFPVCVALAIVLIACVITGIVILVKSLIKIKKD